MNVDYSIDRNLRTVSLIYTGNPDFNEWADTMRAVFSDPGFEPGYSFIMDRRLVTTAPSKDYIEKISAFVKGHPVELGECLTAVVVSENVSYGMARMTQAFLGDDENTQVFKNIDEAKKWLHDQRPNIHT